MPSTTVQAVALGVLLLTAGCSESAVLSEDGATEPTDAATQSPPRETATPTGGTVGSGSDTGTASTELSSPEPPTATGADAGAVSTTVGRSAPTTAASAGSTATPTPDGRATSTPTVCDVSCQQDQPDPDQKIRVENDLARTANLTVSVIRPSGPVVYERSLTLPPEEDRPGEGDGTVSDHRTVYNLRRADPDGVETFRVVAVRNGSRETAVLRTSRCYVGATIHATEGGVEIRQAIC